MQGLQAVPAVAGSVELGRGRKPQKTPNSATASVLPPSAKRSPAEKDMGEVAFVPQKLWSEGQVGGSEGSTRAGPVQSEGSQRCRLFQDLRAWLDCSETEASAERLSLSCFTYKSLLKLLFE